MADRDLLQLLYVTSGVARAGLRPGCRLVLHPETGAIACPMSSWLLWTACRVVALAYSACAVRDAALTLIVSLDVAGRAAVLALLVRVHWIRRRRRRLPRGPGRPLGARWRCWRRRHCCWDAVSLRPARRPAPRTRNRRHRCHQARLAWLRRHVLNLVAAALTRRRRTAALDRASPGVRLPGAARRASTAGPRDGAPSPSTLFVLEWRGEQCRAGLGRRAAAVGPHHSAGA